MSDVDKLSTNVVIRGLCDLVGRRLPAPVWAGERRSDEQVSSEIVYAVLFDLHKAAESEREGATANWIWTLMHHSDDRPGLAAATGSS